MSEGRRRWLPWLLALGGLAVLTCAVGLSVAGWLLFRWFPSEPTFGGVTEDLTREQIASVARITIPPGATNVHALAGGFQDTFIFARFDIPAAELGAFLAGSKHTPPLDSTDWPFQQSLEPDRPWWRPRDAKVFQTGSAFVDGVSQSILVDMTDPQTYIVYVSTFET